MVETGTGPENQSRTASLGIVVGAALAGQFDAGLHQTFSEPTETHGVTMEPGVVRRPGVTGGVRGSERPPS
jgi:hypothetical protein